MVSYDQQNRNIYLLPAKPWKETGQVGSILTENRLEVKLI